MLKLLSVVCFTLSCLASANLFAQNKLAGKVINPDGSPAQKASVTVYDFLLPGANQLTTLTNAEGRFEFIDLPKKRNRLGLRAVSQDAKLCAIVARGTLASSGASIDAKLQLEEAWNFHFDVIDAANMPVEGATALVELADFEFFETRTVATGRAEVILPRSLPIKAVAAWKENVGFDFHSFTQATWKGDAESKLPIAYPEESTDKLVLKQPRTVTIQVVDDQGSPIRNALVSPSVFQSLDEPDAFSLPAGAAGMRTDDGGIVKFNWIPAKTKQQYFSVSADPDFLSSFKSHELDVELVKITLERPSKIRGRVTDPDGSPKAGIKVVAAGRTFEDSFNKQTETDSDGNYELAVKPNGAFIVGIADKQWAAPAQDGIIVPRDSNIDSIDFRVSQPSGISGRMLDVFTRKPVANQSMRLVKEARKLKPDELAQLNKPDNTTRTTLTPRLTIETTTDANGQYEFVAAPGDYLVEYMDQSREQTIGPQPIKVDMPAKVKMLSTFSGTVMNKTTGEPIAKAKVYDTGFGGTWQATTNAEGKFTVERSLEAGFLIAYTKGYAMVGIAHVAPGDNEARFECLPTGSVHGKFVSPDGKPLANQSIEYQLPMQSQFGRTSGAFSKSVKTNDQGEFTIKPVFAGYEYFLGTPGPAGRMNEITKFKIEPGQTLDLGELKE